jgi:hypothetical protein
MFCRFKETRLKCASCGVEGLAQENLDAYKPTHLSITWVWSNSTACHAWPLGEPLPTECPDCRRKVLDMRNKAC